MEKDHVIIILSIETATPVCSVALHVNGELAAIAETFTEKSHSSSLVPMIQDILHQAGIEFENLSAVAVSKGPGSYTGLRIGVSTAKGISFARDIPLIGVGTLEALARQVDGSGYDSNVLICPMLDARRMEVYTLLCRPDGTLVEPVHAKIITDDSFNEYLAEHEIIFAGPGVAKCRGILSVHSHSIIKEGIETSARTIGEIACQAYLSKNFENTVLFEPFYLKEFQTTVPKPKI